MFRKMRRFAQQMATEECVQVLQRVSSGVLALEGDDGYPYAVPLNFVYHDGRLSFHCAVEGHKLDAIARNEKGSFCVVDQDEVVPERYTTAYRSVIAFGRLRVLEDEEKREAIERLTARYVPDNEAQNRRETEGWLDRLCMLEMRIEHMTGKEGLETQKMKGK